MYVVKPDSSVEMRTITTGPAEGDEMTVKTGIQAGDVVVTDGVDKLQGGTKWQRSRNSGSQECHEHGGECRPVGRHTSPVAVGPKGPAPMGTGPIGGGVKEEAKRSGATKGS